MKVSKLFIVLYIIALAFCIQSCGDTASKAPVKDELSNEAGQQDSLYAKLSSLIKDGGGQSPVSADSLAFLIVPLQESCPSCLSKTIDSILKYKESLRKELRIVIAMRGGKKMIRSYFIKEDGDLPVIPSQLFLDSTNQSSFFSLFTDNPVVYYTADNKVYRKVKTSPATIKQDLSEFFSGSVSQHETVSP